MTWCSVDNATPRFDLASSAIRCRFVDRFVRLKVLSRVSRQRFSPRDAPLPSAGSWRVQFPSVIGTMKALRPPPSASPVTYLVRSRCPRESSLLRVRCFQRSHAGGGPAPGQDHCSAGDPIAGSFSRGREWDISGSQATHPVPLPRSRTPAGPTAPRQWRSCRCCPCCYDGRGSSVTVISRLMRGFGTCCLRFKNGVTTATCKTRFRLAGWPLPGGGRTLWIAMKGFRALHALPPFLDLA
jgi:hypothetical protein